MNKTSTIQNLRPNCSSPYAQSSELLTRSAVDATLLHVRPLGLDGEGVDPDPEQGEDGGEQHGPDDDDGGRPVLPPHETLEERVEMHDHPEGEEELAEERAPRLVPVVDGVGDARHHADDVDHQQRRRRDEEGGPLEGVELRKLVVLVSRGLGGDGEVGVDPGQDLEQALDDGEQVRRHAADDPELLVPPPLLDAHPAPPQLQDARREDGDEEGDEEETGEALEPLEVAALVAVEQRAVPAEEDLHGPQRPPQHLVETVRQVDRRRPLEGRQLGHAVDRPPPAAVHLEPGQDVLRDRPVDPPQLHPQSVLSS
ncbi:unnamed protein product [Triticum turgidum subsp. durum]|uniref:Uncharacterized protein n=2 Tax=Triticum TaxID=4564 RepID=A0A9R1ALX7_TRITD|nr:unnamed protein product [Triticum turgidum subsp. durum]